MTVYGRLNKEKEDEFLKKIWNAVAKDLWIVLLDIIAVNAAYYLALIIRFFTLSLNSNPKSSLWIK